MDPLRLLFNSHCTSEILRSDFRGIVVLGRGGRRIFSSQRFLSSGRVVKVEGFSKVAHEVPWLIRTRALRFCIVAINGGR